MAGHQSLTDTIVEQLRKDLVTGKFKAGEKIAGEKELAVEYNVSHVTINRALYQLSNEGYITRKKGAGTFVSDKLLPSLTIGLTGTRDALECIEKTSKALPPSFKLEFNQPSSSLVVDYGYAMHTRLNEGHIRELPKSLFHLRDRLHPRLCQEYEFLETSNENNLNEKRLRPFAMPISGSPAVLYFNKEIFQKNNIPFPNESWSWEDLQRTVEKLNTKGSCIPYVFGVGEFLLYCLSAGIRWKSIEDFSQSFDANGIFPTELYHFLFTHGAQFKNYIDKLQSFSEGKVAMMIWNGNFAYSMKDKSFWDCVPVPIGPVGRLTRLYSFGISGLPGDKDWALMESWIEWTLSKTFQNKLAEHLYPARLDVQEQTRQQDARFIPLQQGFDYAVQDMNYLHIFTISLINKFLGTKLHEGASAKSLKNELTQTINLCLGPYDKLYSDR